MKIDDDFTERKRTARKDARLRRKAAKLANPDAPTAAMEHALKLLKDAPGAAISGYRAIQSELDPGPLMHALHSLGTTLCVPVIDGPDRPLSFARWTPDMPMIEGAFGAEIPAAKIEPVTPAILLVPLLAFDREGYRLGYGGGFYDRTLEMLRASASVRAYGLAYADQEEARVPIEPTDQRLDGIITERGIIQTG